MYKVINKAITDSIKEILCKDIDPSPDIKHEDQELVLTAYLRACSGDMLRMSLTEGDYTTPAYVALVLLKIINDLREYRGLPEITVEELMGGGEENV